jgi:mannosyltransferase
MRRHLPLTGIIVLAALLRLPGLGSRSLWLDEGAEYQAVRGSFGHMLDRVVHTESTPPLSFVYEWLATKLIGTSEFALRLPFALAGIAVVAVVYVAGRDLAGRRAGLIAAALAATNPFLVWHSQDARSYMLLVLFLAGTIVALKRDRLWWWAALAIAALATHHFAIFVLLPEAAWMLRERGRPARAPVALAAAALVPLAVLALSQADDRSAWIGNTSIVNRLVQVPAGYLVGYQLGVGAGIAAGLVVAVPVALALLAAWRPRPGPGRIMLLLGLAGIALPIAAAAAGRDYLIPRTVIGSLVPLLLAAAIGLERMRRGVTAVILMSVIWIAISVATANDPKFRREDWRAAAKAARGADAVLVVPGSGSRTLTYYRRDLLAVDGASVRSLAILRMGQSSGFGCRIPRGPSLPRSSDVRLSRGRCWQVERRAWPQPRPISPGDYSLLR